MPGFAVLLEQKKTSERLHFTLVSHLYIMLITCLLYVALLVLQAEL
jgi:hypothetical protein